jgi:hypothetical protein
MCRLPIFGAGLVRDQLVLQNQILKRYWRVAKEGEKKSPQR